MAITRHLCISRIRAPDIETIRMINPRFITLAALILQKGKRNRAVQRCKYAARSRTARKITVIVSIDNVLAL